MKFIGITGGVGAGKSAVLDYLDSFLDIRVLKADDIAKTIMEEKIYPMLEENLKDEDIFDNEGKISREKLAKVMFQNPEIRKDINSQIHPLVKEYVIKEYEKEEKLKNLRFFVLEAALLIEDGYEKICDELWYIFTTQENRIKRLKEARGYTEDKIQNIFKSQLSEEEFRAHCVKVIDNNGTYEELVSQLKELLQG